jgi:hypothetical protein
MSDTKKTIDFTVNSTFIDNDEDFIVNETDRTPKADPKPQTTIVHIDSDDNTISPDSSPNQINTLRKIGSKTFRTHIIKNYIRPRLLDEVKFGYIWRDRWAFISDMFVFFSELFCVVQTALAFTASTYDLKLLSFLAGLVGVLCIAFNRFGTYARSSSSEKTSQVNELLNSIGIKDALPDLMDKDYDSNDKK